MKILKLLTILSVSLLIWGCATDKTTEGFTINVNIDGFDNCDMYLFRNSLLPDRYSDTLAVGKMIDGKGILKGKVDVPCNAFISFKQKKKKLRFLLENSDMEINAHIWNTFNAAIPGAKIKGSSWNDRVNGILETDETYTNDYTRYLGLMLAGRTLRNKEERKEDLNLIYKLSDDAWFGFIRSRRTFLKTVMDTTSDYRFKLLAQLAYRPYGNEEYTELITGYEKAYGSDYNSKYARLMQKRDADIKMKKERLAIGKSYIDFSIPTFSGDTIQFSDKIGKGKYILLEFWASWCKPCRAEIPELKECYHKYKSKGFDIFAVSCDDKRKSWEKATEIEQIPYTNTSDLTGLKGELCEKYGIKGLPFNLLLDPDGKIIARELRGKNLDEKLHELLQ